MSTSPDPPQRDRQDDPARTRARRPYGFLIRGALPGAGELLASWKLSVVLMVLAALYNGLLAIWARSSPPHVVQNIAGLVPFWAVYALLLLNTGFCLWKRLPALLRGVQRAPTFAGANPRWELAAARPRTDAEVLALLRRLGYRAQAGVGELWGVRRRWSALGTYLFHCAFFLVALGFVLTLLARDELKLWVAVDEEFTGTPEQILSREGQPGLGVPDLRFAVEQIAPEFWRDQLLFTSLSARLRLEDGGRGVTRINRPLWLRWDTFLRLTGFGYTLRYEVLDPEGRLVESSFVKMNVFPPGQRDAIRLQQLPYRVYVEVFPDLVLEEGAPATRSLNLVQPGFGLHVFRGKVDLGERLVRLGEPTAIEAHVLRVAEVRYWGEFSLLRDPGAPLLLLGFGLALAGLVLRLRGRRGEVLWRSGTLHGFGDAPRPTAAEQEREELR